VHNHNVEIYGVTKGKDEGGRMKDEGGRMKDEKGS